MYLDLAINRKFVSIYELNKKKSSCYWARVLMVALVGREMRTAVIRLGISGHSFRAFVQGTPFRATPSPFTK